ncbi:TRAP transporter substrate-binding protein [Paraurantiacibacter namhicola]|uniref:2,3-diketo-L-gulonate-binding periplasmic protein YiaO n=1 Tax=Paraurantiacibacter namhicola TaxID=645517 RepID=A0A1C7D7R1_9SPHN|nr:TRAP transporter substrate-binding protein [Paraurantiacibacter namhicola]ANU07333.1 2,3-diketo-L-gulonate-binding periplasmic protein YiaO precursor [Paraurantiacibacter namhicola]
MTNGPHVTRRMAIAGSAALAGACSMRLGDNFTACDTHPLDYPTVQAVVRFGEMLTERSGGKFGLSMYAGGQLGNERDTLEITSFGGIDFNRVNLAPLNSIEPLTTVAALPFIFESTQHMRSTLDGPIGEEILASLEQHNLIGLCFYDSGARSFYNTRGPIRTPEDMKGLKLRVPGSDLFVAMVKSLGADAVPMPLDEVYQSLAQGVIDGAENNWPSFEQGRHFEVARFYSLTRHLLAPEVFVMSKQSWDKLSPEEQAIVRQSAKDSVPIMRQLWDAQVARSQEVIMASGVEVNEVDPAAFTDRMKGMWAEFITTPDQRRLVDAILANRQGG